MPSAPSMLTPAKQVAEFVAKYDPDIQKLARACRTRLRKRLPTAFELVYDNYQFLVFGFCTAPRASDCVVSLAVSRNGVALSFYYGATLPDPAGILQGSGKQNRFIRLEGPATLGKPAVEALVKAAIRQAKTPLPPTGRGPTIIQSISAKQRSRRRA